MTILTGRVIAAFSRRFIVETASGELPCQVKGRHLRVVCGDQVEVRRDGDAGVIEAVLPRASLLYRSDAFKSKAIAANVTQLAVVVAARPSFSMELVQRCILAAEDQGIASLLILNKADLPETPAARERLNLLTRIGYPLVTLSALTDVTPLRPALHGHTTLLIGQSGMGKSTLINAPVSGRRRGDRRVFRGARQRAPYHHPHPPAPAGCRLGGDRLARPAGICPAAHGCQRPGARFRRVPPISRALPFPRLQARDRAGLPAAGGGGQLARSTPRGSSCSRPCDACSKTPHNVYKSGIG